MNVLGSSIQHVVTGHVPRTVGCVRGAVRPGRLARRRLAPSASDGARKMDLHPHRRPRMSRPNAKTGASVLCDRYSPRVGLVYLPPTTTTTFSPPRSMRCSVVTEWDLGLNRRAEQFLCGGFGWRAALAARCVRCFYRSCTLPAAHVPRRRLLYG